jgi:hypothetical protein
MRAVKGRIIGNTVQLVEPTPELHEQEVVVLIPTQPEEQQLATLLFAGIWADMPDEEWRALQQALSESVRIGGEAE